MQYFTNSIAVESHERNPRRKGHFVNTIFLSGGVDA